MEAMAGGVVLDNVPWLPIIFTLILCALDIVTGVSRAIYLGEFSSDMMRKGLWHKLGFLFAIFLTAMLQVFLESVEVPQDLEVSRMVLDIPLCLATCIYIIVNEVGSIWENIVQINPEMTKWLDYVLGRSIPKHQEDYSELDELAEKIKEAKHASTDD